MVAERLSVVVTRRLPEAVETRMTELFDVRLRDDDAPLSREALGEAMRSAEVAPGFYSFPHAGSMSEMGTPEMKEKYGDPRRTEIIEDVADLDIEEDEADEATHARQVRNVVRLDGHRPSREPSGRPITGGDNRDHMTHHRPPSTRGVALLTGRARRRA